jgi:hypothetical protein
MKKLFLLLVFILVCSCAYAQTRLDGFTNDTSIDAADELIFWNDGAAAVRNITYSNLEADLSPDNMATACSDGQILEASSGAWVCAEDNDSGGLFTDGGAITYLTSFTDNLAVGGSLATDEFYFNVSSGLFIAEGGVQVSDGTDKNITALTVNRASTDATIAWDETNDEFDFNYPINVAGSGNLITFGNGETIDNVNDDYIEFQGGSGTDDTDIRFDLDGTRPVIESPTDTGVEVADNFYVTNGGTTSQIPAYHQFSFSLESPANADNFLLMKAPHAITIVTIDGIIDPADSGENINVNVRECDSTGDSCATITGTMNIDNDGTTDSSHTNATIDSGDWIDVYMNTIGATLPDNLGVTVIYTID